MGYSKWFEFVVCIVMLLRVNSFQVPITFVQDAIAKGGGKCFFCIILCYLVFFFLFYYTCYWWWYGFINENILSVASAPFYLFFLTQHGWLGKI